MPSRFWTFVTPCLLLVALLAVPPGAAAQDAPAAGVPPAAPPGSPLLIEPTTPEEFFRAAELMTRLARFDLARGYLERFLALNPDDETLLRIRDREGSGVFLRLAKIPELQPLSTQLLERLNAILRQRDLDPARLDALLDDLMGSPQQRATALQVIENIGAPVVPRIVKRLGAGGMDARRDMLIYALTRIGHAAVPPLLGTLDAPDVNVQTAAIEALGRIGAAEAVPYLWSPAYGTGQPEPVRLAARAALARLFRAAERPLDTLTPYGAAGELIETARQHLAYDYPWTLDENRAVPAWVWSPQAETVQMVRLTPETASLYEGTRLARQALGLSPESQTAQALYFALALAGEAERAGPGRPLPAGPGTVHNLALTAGTDVMLRALQQALDAHNAAAAIAALQVLGQIATRDVLHTAPGPPSALVAALNSPDAEVQFAAANTVMQLDPLQSFPQSSRVVPILARALIDSGSPAALVIDPNVQRASAIAGMLGEIGLAADIVATGRQGFTAAADRMDVELIAVHANVVQWPLSETLKNLRADARTAGIPILVYGPEMLRAELEPLLLQYRRVAFVVEPTTAEFLKAQLAPLAHLMTPPPTPEERTARRTTAAFWLAHIANGRRTRVFDLTPAADELARVATDPAVSRNALTALGAIPTISAQRRLAEIAVSQPVEPNVRERAALQLAFHIQRFGLLLAREQVAEIHRAWQTAADPQLATALAGVVGSLSPNAPLVTRRIEDFPPPPVPAP